MKRKILSIVICLAMLISTFAMMPMTASAAKNKTPQTVTFTNVAPFLPPVEGKAEAKAKASPVFAKAAMLFSDSVNGLQALADAEEPDNGVEVSKTATANGDGTYTINLEAYATGEKVISEVTKEVPTDIVLVLDQSGSMEQDMSSERKYLAYENIGNSQLRRERFNGGEDNLYYLVNGEYVEVQVDREYVNDYQDYNATNIAYYNNRNDLYIKNNDGSYQRVTVELTWNGSNFIYTYSVNGQQIAQSNGGNNSPDFGNYGPIYRIEQVREYTYYYQTGQNRVVIETSLGDDTVPSETYYEYGTVNNTSRLEALESAVTIFADSVGKKAAGADGQLGTDDDVNHRVAIVGFASRDGYGDNTELLSISGNNSGSVGVEYDSIQNQHLIDVLQEMNTQDGQDMVGSAIDALDAEGATQADLGMDMANRILDANPVAADEVRNRVVILFTDGAPTSFSDFEMSVAEGAITAANSIKDKGTTVYSVGIFPGANATSAGNANGTGIEKSNWFMQNVSSNNGTVQDPSYYLSAADAGALSTIFQQISDNIEEGGSSSILTEEAVVKDIISDQFELPEGATAANITLSTHKCTGKDANGNFTWEKNDDAMGAKATVNGDQVSVTGFDFSKNWCGTETNAQGTTYRGNKLVISFDVKAKAGFIGGNNAYTNESAGIFENADAANPIEEFERPQVNVPIGKLTVTAADKNVYLLGDVSGAELLDGAVVKAGNVTLDLSNAENYGLEAWQTEYVDITVVVKDKGGNEITNGFKDLKDDQKYSVEVTVEPKTDGEGASGKAATMKKSSGAKNINVFKPELTYKDSQVYYGDTAPTDYAGNKASSNFEVWKHKATLDSEVIMIGTKPKLNLTYTPGSGIENSVITTKDDIYVNVTAKIDDVDVTENTTFVHEACNPDCTFDSTKGEFALHVKTCTLTIDKNVGGAIDENQSFLFDVAGNNSEVPVDLEVVIQENGTATITGLPVGTYTVNEDGEWSWRYELEGTNGKPCQLTSANPVRTVTFTNNREINKWLNGNAYCENHFNAFGN